MFAQYRWSHLSTMPETSLYSGCWDNSPQGLELINLSESRSIHCPQQFLLQENETRASSHWLEGHREFMCQQGRASEMTSKNIHQPVPGPLQPVFTFYFLQLLNDILMFKVMGFLISCPCVHHFAVVYSHFSPSAHMLQLYTWIPTKISFHFQDIDQLIDR